MEEIKRKENKREKKINQSKIGGKQKKNKERKKNTERIFGLDSVWTICKIVKSKRKEKQPWLGIHEAITFLVTNQIFVIALVPRQTKEKRKIDKGKAETPKSPNSPQKSNFLKVLLIHDYACYL